MKRIVVSLGLIGLLLGFIGPVSAASTHIEGFGGIKWRASAKDLPDLVPSPVPGKGLVKSYVRKEEASKIGDAEIGPVTYLFYNDKFYSVIAGFGKDANFAKVKETLAAQYGDPKRPNMKFDQYIWDVFSVNINLYYNAATGKGNVSYTYMPEYLLKKKEEKELLMKKESKKHMGD